MKLRSINPKNAELVREFPPDSDETIDAALEQASRAYRAHRSTRFAERAAALNRLADRLDAERERLGRLLTDEMGKTLTAALAEVEKCAWVCRYFADNAESMLADEQKSGDEGSRCSVAHLPLGPVLAVMPWNFPFWQVFRFAAPAIMAGNVVLLKHASNVPRSALALQELFDAAGFARGVFRALLIGPEKVEPVLADRRVQAATVTGSVRAGASVAAIAGKHAKKTVLELGGSDAFIVMPSADLEQAVDTAVTARILNNGQSCIAAKRFILHDAVYDEFVERFVQRFAALRVGDPTDPATDVGPLAMDRLRSRLTDQIRKLLDQGGERLVGASAIDGPGFYFEPGVIASSEVPAAGAFDEELFGPVAWILRVRDFDSAIALANRSQYGLGSSLWTRDTAEVERGVREIEAGSTFVNGMVRSDPRLPFGGIKRSGYGRELARDGILEFVNRKTIVIDSV